MRKLIKRIAIVVIILATLSGLKLAVQYQATLPIEGVVTDAGTGKPIENVIVTAIWHFSRPAVVDTQSWTKGRVAVSDSAGRFQIPAVQTNCLVSTFNYQTLFLNHPLYAFREQYVLRGGKYVLGDVQEKGVAVRLQLEDLEHRYPGPDDNSDLATFFSGIRPEYYVSLRDKHHVRYDLRAVLKKWEYLADRYPQGTSKGGYHAIHMYFDSLRFRMEKLIETY